MKVTKAVITAAAASQTALPLQSLIDRDGEEKPVLAILIEQVLLAKIDEICVIVAPGMEAAYGKAVEKWLRHVRFIPQTERRGYGHAIWCAREFLDGAPFLHLVGDHVYLNTDGGVPATRVLEAAESEECSVSGVQITREGLLPHFGAIGGRRVPGRQGLYRVETVIEKPTPTEAEQKLAVPGLRAGHYLCFFGMHVLTPTVIEILGRELAAGGDASIPLSRALAELAREEQYLAIEEPHRRYDIGARYGLLNAQLALALSGRDRVEVLAQLVELLAGREMETAAGGTGR